MGVLRFAPLIPVLAFLAGGTGLAEDLHPGVSRRIVIPPQSEEAIFNFTFAVPPGARWAIAEAVVQETGANFELYVRFGEPVERAEPGGQIVADFVSATPSSPDEHIAISAASSPPIQTGIYYLGILVKSLDTQIDMTVRVQVETGGPPLTTLSSTFDTGDEGWTRNFPPSELQGSAPGNADSVLTTPVEGYLRLTNLTTGPNRDFVIAPPRFLGNLAEFGNARFRIRLRHTQGGQPLFPIELRLLGSGSAFLWRGPVPEAGDWTEAEARLESSAWSRIAGAASFAEALRNVERLELSMDHSPQPEVTDLDWFVFEGEEPAPVPGDGGPTSSTFEFGAEGWGRNYPASPVPGATIGSQAAAVRHGLGGSGSGGFLLMADGGEFGLDFAVAPPQFIRGLADLDRPWYEFEYRQIAGAGAFLPVKLRLLGNGSVYEWTGARPRRTWERFRVPVGRQYWVHVKGQDDFEAMLRRAQRLEISMDMARGPEINGLDNFHLRVHYMFLVGRALQVDPAEAALEAVPGGVSSEDAVLLVSATGDELNWRATVSPPEAAWLRLSENEGHTPDEIVLSADASSLGLGDYHAEVVITTDEFGVASRRVTVSLTVRDDPRTPVIGGIVQAADASQPLSPGALGSIFGGSLAGFEEAARFDEAQRLPARLADAAVHVLDSNGNLVAEAPLLYASPAQINFQAPYEIADMPEVWFTVVRGELESQPFAAGIAPAGPGIFVLDHASGQPAVAGQDGQINSPENPAPPGGILTVYFTGAGGVEPRIESGRSAPLEPLSTPALPLSVNLSGVAVENFGAVLTPGFAGLAQASFRVPEELAAGSHTLTFSLGANRSRTVTVWVE